MSSFQFIASDFPLDDVKNRKIEHMSIAEAENLNIQLPNWYTKSMNIDRQEKILIYCEKEEYLSEIGISTNLYYGDIEARQATEKKYISSISWKYTDERALQLIDYIKNHLEMAEDLEFWNIWIDGINNGEICEIINCNIGSLEKSHVKYISECSGRGLIVER